MQKSFAFERLVTALLKGRVVFFLGAGVSTNSKVPGDDPFEPTLEWMKRQVAERIGELEQDGELRNTCSAERRLIRMAARKDARFHQLVELVSWLQGHRVLCDLMQIPKFARLEPTPAHRYLAWLAREGLVREIITTNYDCCFERAFLQALGRKPRESDDRLQAVYDLSSYRRRAGIWHTTDFQNVVLLYKINGCALAYEHGWIEPEQVLFTHRQLQRADGPDRRWVHDLIADRMRRHAFCFVGFGSDEAQVHHTILEVLEEFRDAKGDAPSSDPWEAANAPFFAIYSEPSHTHFEIARAYLETARGQQVYGGRSMEKLETNFLDGRLATRWSSEYKLSADLLLQRLYQETYLRLVSYMWREGGFLRRWLATCTEHPGAWLDALLGGAPRRDEKKPQEESEHWSRWLCVEPGKELSPLHRAINRARHPGKAGAMMNRYLAFQEEPLFVGLMLLLLALHLNRISTSADPEKDAFPCVQERTGLGLVLKWPGEDEGKTGPFQFILAHADAPSPNATTDPGKDSIWIRVRIPGRPWRRDADSRHRYRIQHEHGNKYGLRPWRLLEVGIDELIREARRPESLSRMRLHRMAARARGKPWPMRNRLKPAGKRDQEK